MAQHLTSSTPDNVWPTEAQWAAFRQAYKRELGHVNVLGDAVAELKRIWPLVQRTLLKTGGG